MAAGTKEHLKHSVLHLGDVNLWLKVLLTWGRCSSPGEPVAEGAPHLWLKVLLTWFLKRTCNLPTSTPHTNQQDLGSGDTDTLRQLDVAMESAQTQLEGNDGVSSDTAGCSDGVSSDTAGCSDGVSSDTAGCSDGVSSDSRRVTMESAQTQLDVAMESAQTQPEGNDGVSSDTAGG
ncbi:unnamed protein product [Boreogadus saida]